MLFRQLKWATFGLNVCKLTFLTLPKSTANILNKYKNWQDNTPYIQTRQKIDKREVILATIVKQRQKQSDNQQIKAIWKTAES